MTPIDRFERRLPAALTDLADPRTPDYFTDILGLTARTRQRPAWASIERWLPMDITTQRVPHVGIPWRQLGILAVLVALLAAVLAFVVGSRPQITPAPLFGPAENGRIPYGMDGDLYAGDPSTGESTVLLAGETYDHEPIYSRDGTRIGFLRRVDPSVDGVDILMAMGADGSDPRPVTSEALRLDWWDWAPDGRSMVVVHQQNGVNVMQLFDADGVEAPRRLAQGISVQEPAFRPPDGAEILFRGEAVDGVRLYVMAADGTDVRPLTEPISGNTAVFELRQPRYSPDGERIAYHAWDKEAGVMRLYVMDADGANRREVRGEPGTYFLAWPVWSNDGTRIAAQRGRDLPSGGSETTFVVIDVEAGTTTPTGPTLPEDGGVIEWAPDDSMLLMVLNQDGARHLLLDPAGGPWSQAPWDSDSYPSWQRTAP